MEEPEWKNLCNPFRDSATHQKLKNKFFIEYLTKGTAGLPIREVETDPRHGGQTYYDRVMENYANKAPDYEEKLQIHHQPASAEGRRAFRRKHCPAASQLINEEEPREVQDPQLAQPTTANLNDLPCSELVAIAALPFVAASTANRNSNSCLKRE